MANFKEAFEKTLNNEGGYVLHEVFGDRGGKTYAGISRKYHPGWLGWKLIDEGYIDGMHLERLVKAFYEENFWSMIRGSQIKNQAIANNIYDFAVNAGVRTASKLVQLVVDTEQDGIIGQETLSRINSEDAESFITKYTLAKIIRYTKIVENDDSQRKFLLGWIRRAIRGLV